MGVGPLARFLRPSRSPKGRQQVAAVCYRIRRRGIEFLLVQTRGGRWIFPKGGVEPGLTHAQSAALEACEEAGVHGRMEEIAFARYFRRKPVSPTKGKRPAAARSAETKLAVAAHLCQVLRLEPPQESNRNPTWFSTVKAKQRLLKGRVPEFGAELARVVDRAAVRIRRLQGDSSSVLGHAKPVQTKPVRPQKDALQEVRFEALELARGYGMALSAYARYIRGEEPEIPIDARVYKVLRDGPSLTRPVLQLKSGTASLIAPQRVQSIDEARPDSRAKASAKSAKNRRE